VATVLSLLSTRSNATGKELEDLTLKTIKLAKTQREDVATVVPLVTRAFGDWGIATNQQAKAMDYFRTVSQQTGSQVSKLAEQVVAAGAPLRQLGYNFEQAVALIGKFDKEGVNTELVLGGMKAALQKFSKEGITDTATAWQQFVAGVKSGSITLQQVSQEVGAKRGVDLYKAITEGRFEIDKMVESTKKLATEGGASIETMTAKFTKFQHQVESVVSSHRDLIVTVGLIAPAFSSAFGGITKMVTGAISLVGGLTTALTIAGAAAVGLAGYFAGDWMQKKFAPGGGSNDKLPNYQVYGHQVGAAPAIPNSILDYINGGNKPAAGGPPPPPAAAGLTAEELKKDFSALGISDLKDQLDAAVKAFGELTSAGKLSAGQIALAKAKIEELKAALANQGKSYTIGDSLKADEANSALERVKKTLADFYSTADPNKHKIDLIPDIDITNLPQTFDGVTEGARGMVEVLGNAVNAWQLNASNAKITADAFHYFGVKSTEDLKESGKDLEQNFEIMKSSGIATAHDLDVAFVKMKLNQIELDHELGDTDDELYAKQKKNAEDTLKALDGEHVGVQRQIKDRYDLGQETERLAHSTFDSFEKGFASMVVQGKFSFDSIKELGQRFAEDLYSILLKTLFKPVEDAFAKWAGQALSGLSGGANAAGGAANAAGGAASAGSAAAAGASGGLGGIINMASGIASAVSGIIGNFQMAHISADTGRIEVNTRSAFFELQNIRADLWSQFGSMYYRLGEVLNASRGGGGGNTFNFYNTDINDVVRELKLAGVLPS